MKKLRLFSSICFISIGWVALCAPVIAPPNVKTGKTTVLPPAPPPPPIITKKDVLSHSLDPSKVPKLADLDTNAPDYVVLSKITVTNGTNVYEMKLSGLKYPSVQANSQACVVIIPLKYTNYVFETTAAMGGFSNWVKIAQGSRIDTNTALIFIDFTGNTNQMRWFRQTEADSKTQ